LEHALRKAAVDGEQPEFPCEGAFEFLGHLPEDMCAPEQRDEVCFDFVENVRGLVRGFDKFFELFLEGFVVVAEGELLLGRGLGHGELGC
jgi:hypothetical protein